ncbi:MAG: T9SS type A sorting domain-containing protein [Bacteroidetes bacterium]|nr:T9SS type A sorting domain-containing protein [Bacteroidota bacterium]
MDDLVYVVNGNDLVFMLNDKTAGRFKLSWWMYVVSGKLGYFNVLNDFAAANSVWALQCYLENDSIFVDAGATTAVKTSFPTSTWKEIAVIVDLDDDFATFYIDNIEIISYKWSKGAFGTGSTLKMDAIDFYGWDGDTPPSPTSSTQSGYYIDDLSYDSVPAPTSPMNLVATVNGADIDVSWTAPATTPDLYKLSRNGKVVFSTTGLTYTDVAPWANTYIYGARAHYAGLGYSHSSNTDTAVIPGGVDRNMVLFESGTGTWCQYCPGSAMGIRDLIEVNNKDVAAVEYHQGDNYEIAAGLARLSYYNITAFPTVQVDGVLPAVGGNATTSLYTTYLPMYQERIGTPGFHAVDCSISQLSATNYQATITINQTFAAFPDGFKLHTALTESNIPEVWGNQTEVDYVCRGMFPNEYGTDLDFNISNPVTLIIPFSTAGFIKNNCEFVAWIQHVTAKEVTQTVKVAMSSVVGIDELQGKKISIYPNPASDYIQVLSNGKGEAGIYDVTGKLVKSVRLFTPTQVISLSDLVKGVYFLKITNSGANFTEKLVIQ